MRNATSWVFPLNFSLSGSICLSQNKGQSGFYPKPASVAQLSYCDVKFHHYSFGCGCCSFKRLLTLVTHPLWKGYTTVGVVDRNMSILPVPSNSCFCAATVSCSHAAQWMYLFLLPLWQMQWFLTAVASKASVVRGRHFCGILMWSAGGKNSYACLSCSC